MARQGEIRLSETPAPGDTITLTGDNLEALKHWGPRPGMAVTVLSGSGESLRARVISVESDHALLLVFERMPGAAESGISVTLVQALPDKERMELIIEKTAELGVDVIVPWKAARGIDLDERDRGQQKSRHWQRRAAKAAKQCRRGRIPAIMPFTGLKEALEQVQEFELKLALYEKEGAAFAETLAGCSHATTAALLVGPEGGLAEWELSLARQAGFVPLHLGGRILRTETAAIAAVTIIQYALGDLGGK
ncbi:MAG: RsmE family RNA methyltransferase [bacterium]